MRAWQVSKWSEPEEMAFNEIPPPDPGPGEIRIRNRAAALNFFDILQIQGKYQIKPPFPFTPGAEVAGAVDALGPRVTRFAHGARVLALTQQGGYAEYSIAPADRAFPIPAAMNFPEAASMLIVYQTSYFGLKQRGGLRPHEWLLVHAGASGVGYAAIQIGRAMGARIIATAGSRDKLDFCLEQGAHHAISYHDPAWVEQVKNITEGRGADVIYDPVGGDIFDLSTKCIAPEGRLLVVGFAGGRIPSVQANRILLKNIAVTGVLWGGYVTRKPGFLAETQDVLFAMYNAGQIRPRVTRHYPLADAVRALRDLGERKISGKAVLTME